MKKFYVTTFLLMLLVQTMRAQFVGDYACFIEAKTRTTGSSSSRCDNFFDMTVALTDDSKQNWRENLIPTDYFKTDVTFFKLPVGVNLKWATVYGIREWRNDFGCNGNSGSRNLGMSITLPCYRRLWDESTNPIPQYIATLEFIVRPSTVNIYYFGVDNTLHTDKNDLPSDDVIMLKAYPEANYIWEYEKSPGNWQRIPNSVNGTVVAFRGYDLFSKDEFFNKLNTNVIVRARYDDGWRLPNDRTRGQDIEDAFFSNKPFTLSPKVSAPKITSLSPPVMETCFGYRDAQLIVHFDRQLGSGETLSIFPSTEPATQKYANIESFVVDTNGSYTYTMKDLAPGDYSLSLIGKLRGGVTYTDGNNHFYPVSIPVRTAITNFIATPEHVHCYNGQDGKINVSAQGGTANYTAFLELNNASVTQISLSQNSGNTFTGLPKGNYVVRLKDSYGCDPKQSNGDIEIKTPVVSQPVKGVTLSVVEAIEPLGYGHEDGYITVRTTDGTMPYTFYWTDKLGNSRVPDAPETQGQTMLSTLPNIGKGLYHILARDTRYAMASPQTEVNTRGCYDTLSIVVDEPPVLEVKLKERHFVSCYGFTDGELSALAKGGRPFVQGNVLPYTYEWFTVSNNTPVSFNEQDSVALERFSALYRVKVTDRNGITAWSPDLMLVQPNVLKVTFNTTQLRCNGDSTGMSTAIPQGGTPPYSYTWSTDGDTDVIENLVEGSYSVFVTDERGCPTLAQTQVVVPNSLEVDSIVVDPTCYGYKDGSIQLTVKGGRTPYQFLWQHGAHTKDLPGVGSGSYHVKITDANDCFVERDYSLSEPEVLPVSLGGNHVLCTDQTLDIDASINDPLAQYTWSKDGKPFSTLAKVHLVDAGNYKVRVTSKACANEDDLTINRSNVEISADFVVATRVAVNEGVKIVNISHPAADNMEWIIPDGVKVQEKQDDHIKVIFPIKGEYSFGMRSRRGECEKEAYQIVRVVDRSELKDYVTPDEPYIKQFIIAPNPNKGRFKVTVQLREEGSFKLSLYNSVGNLITEQNVAGQLHAEIDMDVSTVAGTGLYMLRLISSKVTGTLKVVVE